MDVKSIKVRPTNRHRKNTPLERRAEMLLRRGFDVPPSRQSEYNELRHAGYAMQQIKDMMELE